ESGLPRGYGDARLSPGATYTYMIVTNGSCCSNFAGVTTYAPPNGAPSGLGATAVSGSQISISWADASSNESSFNIERKTGAGGAYSYIASVGVDGTSFTDGGLAGGNSYFYRVYAANAWGNYGYSNEATA